MFGGWPYRDGDGPASHGARHNERVTNNDEGGTPSTATGFVVGMLVGVPIGVVLGLSVFDNIGIGLVLGSGVGGVLGITFPAVRRSRQSV